MRKTKDNKTTATDPAFGESPHPTVWIEHGDQQASVDKKIAPLVLEMWKAGISTYMSCQGNPEGWVWLVFDSIADLEEFLRIVGRYDPRQGSLYDRMLYGYDRRVALTDARQWHYETLVLDISAAALGVTDYDDEAESLRLCEPLFQVAIALEFPVSDLRTVLQRLRAYNDSP